MYYMYALYVCIICMYYRYVLYVCVICMYYVYVLYVCKASWPSRPPGAKSHGKRNLQIQGCIHFFEKMALNRVLTLPDCRSRSQLSESGLRSQKGPLGVEL